MRPGRDRIPDEVPQAGRHRNVLLPRFGHNEGDEPAFTQPKMYKAIRAHKTVVQLY